MEPHQNNSYSNSEIERVISTVIFDANYEKGKYIKPSQFICEMQLSAEERIEKLCKSSKNPKPASELQLNTFTVTPNAIVFQNFEPGIIYSSSLSFLNNCEISKPLKKTSESGYFTVTPSSSKFSFKVAPGITQTYNVTFCAPELKDYFCQLTFLTEAESILVPAIALCPRGILTFPDDIKLPKAIIRIGSSRSIIVKNIGKANAKITLKTYPPFHVQPQKTGINPGEATCIQIIFKPIKVNHNRATLMVFHDTGEKLAISLEGDVNILNVKLETSRIQFNDIFMGMKTHRSFRLYNDGDEYVHFSWKKNENFEEIEDSKRIKEKFEEISISEFYKSRKLEEFDLIDSEDNKLIYERILKDELEDYENGEHYQFSHPNFQIIPLVGDIPPKSSSEITAIFSPNMKKSFKGIAYCDVVGMETRLPLIFKGRSLGPNVILNVDTLDVNKIYFKKIHKYDVSFTNCGFIKGTVTWIPYPTSFGGNFCCENKQIVLESNELKIIMLEFSSDKEGKFVEEVIFRIEESGEMLNLVFMGEIFCPELELNKTYLNYHIVPLGVPIVREIELKNMTKTDIEYEFFVTNDGNENPINIYELMNEEEIPQLRTNPKIFQIDFASGQVEANSNKNIKIKLIANKKGNYSSQLILKMWNLDNHVKTISVDYNAQTPLLDISPEIQRIPMCLINVEYKNKISIRNKTGLLGYFYLLPLKIEGNLQCSVYPKQGIINPFSVFTLESTVICFDIGEHEVSISGVILGEEPIRFCKIICIGQGPDLYTEPEVVNFGKIPCLEPFEQELLIINKTPIPASIEVFMHKNSNFAITPTEIDFEGNSTVKLIVKTYLEITKTYKETITIKVKKGFDLKVQIVAIGTGTMILCEPKLWPEYDLGTHYTHKKIYLNVTFTNKGNQNHKILWSRNKFLKQLKEIPDVKLNSVFQFDPAYFELFPEDSIDTKLVGFSKRPCNISEDFYCHAVLEKERNKKIVASFILMANFVNPVLEISKKDVTFFLNILPTGTSRHMSETITLTNKSTLSLDVVITTKDPFYFVYEGFLKYKLEFHMEDEEIQEIKVCFKPVLTKKRSYERDGEIILKYVDHPNYDVIKLKGSVHYPNVKLSTDSITFMGSSPCGKMSQEVLIKNITAFPVGFSVFWDILKLKIGEEDDDDDEVFPIESLVKETTFSRNSSIISEDTIRVSLPSDEISLISLPANSNDLTIERVKFYVAKEKYLYYHHVILVEMLSVAECKDECTEFPSLNEDCMDKIHTLLYPIVDDFHKNVDFCNIVRILPENEKSLEEMDDKELLNNILKVFPYYGYLSPFETAIVSINFRPRFNTILTAYAIFDIGGGADEKILINGACGSVKYSISTKSISFERVLFQRLHSRTLKVRNKGSVDIKFDTNSDLRTISKSKVYGVGWRAILPFSGAIQAKTNREFELSYFPGVPGEFHEDVIFNFSFEPPEIVHLHGFGVFPQIYLNLPRPGLFTKESVLLYVATATLTTDYLKTVLSINDIYRFKANIKIIDNLSKFDKKQLIEDGFHVCSLTDFLPSPMDIDLSIERTILHEYLRYYPSILKKTIREDTFWSCPMPPYEVNFGHVTRDTITDKTINIFNYGPTVANMKLITAKDQNLEAVGITVQFKNISIKEGNVAQLHIIFAPSKKFFTITNYDLFRTFYLVVNYGIKVPVTICAVVVIPTLLVNRGNRRLNFGDVQCGKCFMKTIILKNSGYVLCKWKAVVKAEKRKPDMWIDEYWKVPNFYVGNSKGELNPNESCFLHVYFEPQWSGMIETKLVINIQLNDSTSSVHLRGYGVEPIIQIVEQNINFEPCAPYPPKNELIFYILNLSTFPLEFFFTDFDQLCDKEEAIINLITDYYETDRVLIPNLKAGERLPPAFHDFYMQLLNATKDELSRKTKSLGNNLFGAGEYEEESSYNVTSISEKPSADPLKEISFQEIQLMLKTTLKEKMIENKIDTIITEDPIKKAFADVELPVVKDPTDLKEGVVLIFYGAPLSKFKQIANYAALNLEIQCYSIDRLILEAIVYSDSLASLTTLQLIENAFSEIASEIDLLNVQNENEYESLIKKIELILSGKVKKKAPKGDKKDKSKPNSPASSKSSAKSKKKDKFDTFIGIPLEHFETLLKLKFDSIKNPIVIESLESYFIKKPLMALNSILKSLNNIRCVHFVLISQTYNQRKIIMEAEKKAEEERVIKEHEDKLQQLKDLQAEELENLSDADMEIYKKEILPMRKLESLLRKQKFQQKILEKKLGKQASKIQSKKQKDKKDTTKRSEKDTKPQSAKSDKSSAKSSKGNKKEVKNKKVIETVSQEEKELKSNFLAFEADLYNIQHVCEYWDRKYCLLTKPLPEIKKGKGMGSPKSQKSGKKSKTSSNNPSTDAVIQELQWQNLSPEEKERKREIGLPLWLFNNAQPEKLSKETIAFFLKNTSQIQQAMEKLEESLNPELVEKSELFSVLHKKTEVRLRHDPVTFCLKNFDEKEGLLSIQGDENSEASKISKESSKVQTKKSKKRFDSEASAATSKASKINPQSSVSIKKVCSKITPRNSLEPSENIIFVITFYPTSIGEYNDQFVIETFGWPCKFILKSYGKCYIPEIDMNPHQLFPKVIKKRNQKNQYWENVYIQNLNVFDFGFIFNPQKSSLDKERTYAREATFSFINKSPLICNLLVCQKFPSSVYEVFSERLIILPNACEELTVTALPSKKFNDNELLISIENNPKVEIIRLTCAEANVQCVIEPEEVYFQRVVVDTVKTEKVFLKNESPMTISWMISDFGDTNDNYDFDTIGGLIGGNKIEKIKIEYAPTEPEILAEDIIEIKVYDEFRKSEKPLFKGSVKIKAEAIEVNLLYDFEIEYGEIKYEEKIEKLLDILNTGKYQVDFIAEFIEEPEEKPNKNLARTREMFTLDPLKGKLNPKKNFQLKLNIEASRIKKFEKIPIFKIYFTDPVSKEVIETAEIVVSGKIIPSRFEFCPPAEINFGQQLIGTEKIQQITLTNKGKFPFDYRCLSVKKYIDELRDLRNKMEAEQAKPKKKNVEKESKKSDKDSKKKDKKKEDEKKKPKLTKMAAGPFSIISADGTVEPNQTIIMNLHFEPKDLGDQKQYFLFFITNSISKYSRGYPLVVMAKSCVPKIDFDNIGNILKEVITMKSKSELGCGRTKLKSSLFLKLEGVLLFKSTCINKTETVKLLMKNNSGVPGFITSTILATEETAFKVQPDILQVPPYSIAHVKVSFTPYAAREFKSSMQLFNNITGPQDRDVIELELGGEGLLPEIKITDPVFCPEQSNYFLFFDPTLVGDSTEKSFSFRNVGIISCVVVLEIVGDNMETFKLLPEENTIKYLNFWGKDLEEPSRHTNLVNLNPNEEATFLVTYKAQSAGNSMSLVILHLIDNPFESFEIILSADTFENSILIEGLDYMKPDCIKYCRKSNTIITELPIRSYEIDFSNTPINTLKYKKFTITNVSKTDTFRFQFVGSEWLEFFPSVGHLKPNAAKDVIVTFISEEFIFVEKEKVECKIDKIFYKHKQHEALSWDDRQTFTIWKPEEIETEISKISLKKDTESSITSQTLSLATRRRQRLERKEPEFEIDKSISYVINIYAKIVSSYTGFIYYSEDVITLPHTYIFEKGNFKFKINNPTCMDLNIQWYFTEVDDEDSNERSRSAIITSCKKTSGKVRPKTCINISSSTILKQQMHRPFHLTGAEVFLYGDQSTISSKSLFGSSSSSLCNSNCSCENVIPFLIEPTISCIKGGENKIFDIIFSPKKESVYEAYLQAVITNLDPTMKPPKIRVKAKSMLPLYHFELEPSNYLSERRQGTKSCGIADENTKVFEIEAIGLDESVTKTFGIVNPTGESFNYKCIPFGTSGADELSVFHIHNPEGCITAGKTLNITVTFLPKSARIFEKFYQFLIEKYEITTNFLIVGTAREPRVNFLKCHLDLKPALIGQKTWESVILKNCENIPIAFQFKKETFCSDAGHECVEIDPLQGIVLANCERPLRISFCSTKIGETRFDLKCKVEKMKKSLTLDVYASFFEVEPIIIYEIKGSTEQILEANQINMFHFKNLFPRNTEEITFKVENRGKIAFFYNWIFNKDKIDEKLQFKIDPADGFVQANSTAKTVMTLTPLAKTVIRKLAVTLKIPFGPSYTIHISGDVAKYSFKFSFEEYDFGKCLIQDGETMYYNKILEFTNSSDQDVVLENKAPKMDFLTVDLKSDAIKPKGVKKILIFFHPKEEKVYNAKLRFTINSQPRYIKLKGEGVPLKLELETLSDRFLHLGSPLIGKTASKSIKVINRSKADVSVIFDIWDRLPFYTKPKQLDTDVMGKEEKKKKGTGMRGSKSMGKLKGSKSMGKMKSSKSMNKLKGSKSTKSAGQLLSSKSFAQAMKGTQSMGKLGGKSQSKLGGKSAGNLGGKSAGNLGGKSAGNLGSKSSSKLGSKSSSKLGSKSTSKLGKKSTMKLGKSKSRASRMGLKRRKRALAENDPEAILRRQIKEVVTVTPTRHTKLAPNKSMSFTISFSPKTRFKMFTEKISYQVQDKVEGICTFKTSSLEINFEIDKDIINFGNIVKNYSKEEKLCLSNLGNTKGKFSWKFDNEKQKYFTINPMSGTIPPDSIVTFVVKFEPTIVQCTFKRKLRCTIEGFKKVMEVSLVGYCVKLPPADETLIFKCPVRQSDTKTVKLENLTNDEWIIKPQINGNYFSASNFIILGPRSVAQCEIIYKPLVMTDGLKNHDGIIIIYYPNSKVQVYSLKGTADLPLPEGTISKTISSKTYFTEILDVQNWLGISQQFKVITVNKEKTAVKEKKGIKLTMGKSTQNVSASPSMFKSKQNVSTSPSTLKSKQNLSTKPSSVGSPKSKLKMSKAEVLPVLYKLTGNEVIDVVGNATVKYPWTIYCYTEGILSLQITFKNEKTNEYLFYNLTLEVEKNNELEQIELTTCVRVPIYHKIKFQNILKTAVLFSISDDGTGLYYSADFSVDPSSENFLEVTYDPLYPGKSEVHLNASCPELGSFPYTFILTALPPNPESTINFFAYLGNVDQVKISVANETKVHVVFQAEFEDPVLFQLSEENVEVDPQNKGECEIIFDPHEVGEFYSKVTIFARFAGIYIYPIKAIALPPKPTGPYKIKLGIGCNIPFRNPFLEDYVFKFCTDSDFFVLKTNEELIKSKTSSYINVTCSMSSNKSLSTSKSSRSTENEELLKSFPTGKLIVFCDESKIIWTYYLQAES